MSLVRAHAFPVAFALVAAVVAVLDLLALRDLDADADVLALTVIANAALVLWPLAKRTLPLVSAWGIAGASLLGLPISEGRSAAGVLFWMLMIAAAWGMRDADRRLAVAHWAAYVVPSAMTLGETPDTTFVAEIFWIGALAGAVYLAARFITKYRDQAVTLRAQALLLEHEREEHARLAAAEERARIARELHDVVAHSVSVMVMHAGAVRRLLNEDQTEQRDALASLEQTGRESMAEIRRALGVLRRPDEPAERAPQPGLASLEQLVEQLRGAGLRIEYSLTGERVATGHNVDIAAYRIAQEALTNVLKHAPSGRVRLLVSYSSDAVEITVEDDGSGAPAPSSLPPGYGLVGLRERASVLGGTLAAGLRAEGGFRVHATLPLDGEA